MSEHCRDCGSKLCNHGNCPRCYPCRHCNGGDINDKYFGDDDEYSKYLDYRKEKRGY